MKLNQAKKSKSHLRNRNIFSNKIFRCSVFFVVIFLGTFLLNIDQTQAATKTWTGGGADGNWSTGANWGGTAPVTNDTLVFPSGPTNKTTTNDVAGRSYVIQITGSGYTLAGNLVALRGNLPAGSGTGNLISLPMTLGGNRTITVTSPGSLTISGVIGGANSVTKAGTGELVLSGLNTYTGATSITGGTLKLGASGNTTNTPTGTVAGGISITAGATLDLNGYTLGTTEALTLRGVGVSGGGALINSSATNVAYSGLITLGAASSIVSNFGNIAITNAGTISGATFRLTLGGTNTGSSVGSIIGNTTGGVTKEGTGTWTLSRANTFSGTVNISAGILKLGASSIVNTSSPTGTTGLISVTAGAALDLAGFSYTSAHTQAISINGTGVSFGGAIMNSGGAATFIGPVTFVTDASVVGETGTIALTGTIPTGTTAITFGGSAGGSIGTVIVGSRNLTKEGSGTWTLSGTNTYTGITTISEGTLALGSAGAISSSGVISFDGGTLQYSAANTTDYSNRFSTAVNQLYNIDTNGQNVTFATSLSSSGGNLTKFGTGILTLSAANIYTGTTDILAGTIKLQAASSAVPPVGGYSRWFDASSASNFSLTGSSSINQWNDLSGNLAHAVPQTGDGYVHNPTYVGNALNGMGAVHFVGGNSILNSSNTNLLFTRDATIRTVFSVFKGASFLITDQTVYDFHRYAADDTDPTAPLFDGPNSWSSANIRGGTTYVNGNIVDGTTFNMPTANNNGFNLIALSTIGNVAANGFNRDRTFHSGDQYQAEVIIYDTALDSTQIGQVESYLNNKWGLGISGLGAGSILPVTTALSIANGATLDLNGSSQEVFSLANYSGSGGSVTNTGSVNSRFTVSGSSVTTFGGVISSGGTNNVSLMFTGSGSLTFSGNNTYTGNTTINNGTLLLSNANSNNISSSPVIAIASGAVLNTTGLSGATDLVLASGQKLTGEGIVTGALNVGGGGIIAPGVNTGTISEVGNATYGANGIYNFQINNATGTAGNISGWDLHNITGTLTIGATSGSKYTIDINSLTAGNVAGNAINFDKNSNYIWTIVTASGGISGFATSSFNIATTSFSNDVSGTAANGYFTIQVTGNSLQLKYNAAALGYLTADIVDGAGISMATSSIDFSPLTFSFNYQTTTSVFGTTTQKIRVDNPTFSPQWSLSIAATAGPTTYWQGMSNNYDFNDPTANAVDGVDADSLGGQMTINPATGTITPKNGCTSTGLSLGSSGSFSQGVMDAITLMTAGASSGTGCYWDLTGISVSQTVPAEQSTDAYSLSMTLSIVAI